MAEMIALRIAMIVIAIGFVTFIALYLTLAKPWQDRMGRHILFFMGGMGLAFVYYVIIDNFKPHFNLVWAIRIWVLILVVVATMIWGSVIVLVRYQIEERKQKANHE